MVEGEMGINGRPRLNPWNPMIAIQRCWWWAIPVGIVLALGAGFGFLNTWKPLFQASYLLEALSPETTYVAFSGTLPKVRNLVEAETALIKNPVVLEPVLANPSLRKTPSLRDPHSAAMLLRDNLSVESGGIHNRMIVSYTDSDPKAAALICNAIVDSYLRQRNAIDSQTIEGLARRLGPEIASWEAKVEQRQRRVSELSKHLMGYAPSDRNAKQEIEDNDRLLRELRSRILDASIELKVLDAKAKLGGGSDSKSDAAESDTEDNNQDGRALDAMRSEREHVSLLVDVLKDEYSKEKEKFSRFSGSIAELRFAQEEMQVAIDVLSKLRTRKAQIQTEGMGGGTIRTVAVATPPRLATEEIPVARMAGISTAAFSAPFLLVYLFGFWPSREKVASTNVTDDTADDGESEN